MTDIEAKALALGNKVRLERGLEAVVFISRANNCEEALCRAIEQHEAFKQEVSDVMTYIKALYPTLPRNFDRFIIPKPKPDPLEEVIKEWWNMDIRENDAETLRELLDARGLEIREKGQ